MEKLLSVHQVARMLNVAEATIYRKARAAHLPTVRVGRLWRFPQTRLERWLNQPAQANHGTWRYTRRPRGANPILKVAGLISDGRLSKDIDQALYGR